MLLLIEQTLLNSKELNILTLGYDYLPILNIVLQEKNLFLGVLFGFQILVIKQQLVSFSQGSLQLQNTTGKVTDLLWLIFKRVRKLRFSETHLLKPRKALGFQPKIWLERFNQGSITTHLYNIEQAIYLQITFIAFVAFVFFKNCLLTDLILIHLLVN